MLFFTSPLLLAAAPVIAVLGLWALWRGKHRRQLVSSTRLWQNLMDSAAGAKSRRVDPPWLLVLLAALLAGLALPGPRWRSGFSTNVPSAQVNWSLRSIRGMHGAAPELFLQIINPHRVADHLGVEYLGGESAENWPEAAATAGEGVTTADALRGIILRPPLPPPLAEQSKLSLRLHSGNDIIAITTFTRPDRPPFALLTGAAPGRRIDPALYRVFAINPAARPNDPGVHPVVLLVDDPGFTVAGLSADTLVIASPSTPLPGIVLGAPITPIDAAPRAVSLPPYIDFKNVQVQKCALAAVSAEWTVYATVDGHPFLAGRKLGEGPALLWLASSPSAETNWPLDRSFVLTFSYVLSRTFPAAANGAADHEIDDWARTDLPTPAQKAAAAGWEVSLIAPLGATAIGLLVVAVVLFVRRGRV